MPDQLTDDELQTLFADLRAHEMTLVRPPGTTAVRGTVRRRRVRAAALGVIVLVAALGASHLMLAPSPSSQAAAAGLSGAVDIAYRAVLSGDSARSAFEDRQPVGRTAYRRAWPSYLGELTVWAACAGSGSLTLVVRAVLDDGGDAGSAPELARLPLPCAGDPAPLSQRFVADQYRHLSVELAATAAAQRQAAFAFRVTSDTGTPIPFGAPQADPAIVLPATMPHGFGGGAGAVPARSRAQPPGEVTLNGPYEPGHYRLQTACAGNGTLTVTVQAPASKPTGKAAKGGTLSVGATVRCSYPPQLQTFDIGAIAGGPVTLTTVYSSASAAMARWEYRFVPA